MQGWGGGELGGVEEVLAQLQANCVVQTLAESFTRVVRYFVFFV